MKRRQRLTAVAAVLLLMGGAKVGQELYRWKAYAPERTQIARLETDLEDAAWGVIATQLRADTLKRAIDEADIQLRSAQESLDTRERQARMRVSSATFESAYRDEVARYNEQVAKRNQLAGSWRETVEGNHASVARYNALADTIRTLALRMGEPYYPIASPAEVAARRGVTGRGGGTATLVPDE